MRPKTSQIVLIDRRSVSLIVLLVIVALVLALLVTGRSAQAQNSQADPLENSQARASNGDVSRDPVDTVVVGPINDTNCDLEVASGATVVLLNDDGDEVTISAAQNTFKVSSNGSQLTITDRTNAGIVTSPPNGLVVGTFDVARSTGITCDKNDDDSGGGAGNGNGNDNGNDNGNGDNSNNLEDLECDELLRRFRGADDEQYRDRSALSDVDVQNQIIVCLEQEVEQGTAADGKLPDTGGLPLLGLAALVLFSAVAGVSVIRGVRREE